MLIVNGYSNDIGLKKTADSFIEFFIFQENSIKIFIK